MFLLDILFVISLTALASILLNNTLYDKDMKFGFSNKMIKDHDSNVSRFERISDAADKFANMEGVHMSYKVVPFSANVSRNGSSKELASKIESILATNVGWEFAGLYQLQSQQAGSSGCWGFGATQPIMITTEFIVLRQ